ncbi:hypothetical protein CRG98_002965 [Punica granatum]|uniref:Uncharacterized protein n=1 Tax=Punica granatum TaxID=22663 RepID=A0A2I0L947_PUNGR|nr:hypothetical protein CRG98_002965 [Punica granatum]
MAIHCHVSRVSHESRAPWVESGFSEVEYDFVTLTDPLGMMEATVRGGIREAAVTVAIEGRSSGFWGSGGARLRARW